MGSGQRLMDGGCLVAPRASADDVDHGCAITNLKQREAGKAAQPARPVINGREKTKTSCRAFSCVVNSVNEESMAWWLVDYPPMHNGAVDGHSGASTV
jgi:hypothetical protein